MPICPVCKLEKPALSFGGACSWGCKGKLGSGRPPVGGPATAVRASAGPQTRVTVRSFFADFGRGDRVAARRENNGNRLFYYRVAGMGPGPLLPSVYLQDYLVRNKVQVRGKVLVNYPVDSWINKNSALEQSIDAQGRDVLDAEIVPQPVDGQLRHWEQFSLDSLGPRPGMNAIGDPIVSSAISKARRIYMLGTFCLLKKFGLISRGGRSQGHNIGAMLVSGEGEVLSWGVNTGEFRHAEVNTIINYFRLNPHAMRLPAKSVLFSTLKPCLMCSTLIQSCWHRDGEPRIWYGMMDEGGSGSTTLLGEWSQAFKAAELELDVLELLSPEGTLDSALKTTGTKPVRVAGQGGQKVDLYQMLSGSGGAKRGMSAADWVDKSDEVLSLIDAAQTKFIGKAAKARDDGPVKRALDHLKPFLS